MSPYLGWRRHALLAIAIILIVAGVLLGWLGAKGGGQLAEGVCLKTGMVTLMWWLALPQLRKLNPYAMGTVGVVAIVAIVRPQVLVVVARLMIPLAPVLFLLWGLWKLKRK